MREENRRLLGPNDVVLATYPGSGASWIGTLLVHLGVFFVSGHDELLLDSIRQETGSWLPGPTVSDRIVAAEGSAEESIERPSMGSWERGKRLPVLGQRDRINPSYREPCRVIKTNQSSMGWTPPAKVLLLVRDGRDAVLSLYHNLCSFGDLKAPLLEFLRGNGGAWVPPAMAWGFSCMSWTGLMPPERMHVLQFEKCRRRPLEEFRAMLGFLGIDRDDREIEAAIEKSSYGSMRQAEAQGLNEISEQGPPARIMRRGQVGEWREDYSREMLATFKGMPRRALLRFGYPVDRVPD